MNAQDFVSSHRVDRKDLTQTPTYALLWGKHRLAEQLKQEPFGTPGRDLAFDQLQRIKRALVARGA